MTNTDLLPPPPRRSHRGLALRGIYHRYVEGNTDELTSQPVLNGVDLDVLPGELVAVMGPSGCGKSTLLLVAAGIISPTEGSASLGDQEFGSSSADERSRIRRHQVGIVFQFGELVAELTLRQNVALAGELSGLRRRAAAAEADQMLARVGLTGMETRKPGQVSGGQAQRCAIARALIHKPDLIIADEPTGALDQSNAEQVLDLMITLTREDGAALLMATHDSGVAARADRLVHMADGLILP